MCGLMLRSFVSIWFRILDSIVQSKIADVIQGWTLLPICGSAKLIKISVLVMKFAKMSSLSKLLYSWQITFLHVIMKH